MSWPSGVQWEWAIGEFTVLGFLVWELVRLRRTQRQDRAKTAVMVSRDAGGAREDVVAERAPSADV